MENKLKSKLGSDNIIGEEVKHNLSKEDLKNIEVKTNKVNNKSFSLVNLILHRLHY